eukprot:scaffold198399_cov30-Tisochrysis_lutea.AAC.5
MRRHASRHSVLPNGVDPASACSARRCRRPAGSAMRGKMGRSMVERPRGVRSHRTERMDGNSSGPCTLVLCTFGLLLPPSVTIRMPPQGDSPTEGDLSPAATGVVQ